MLKTKWEWVTAHWLFVAVFVAVGIVVVSLHFTGKSNLPTATFMFFFVVFLFRKIRTYPEVEKERQLRQMGFIEIDLGAVIDLAEAQQGDLAGMVAEHLLKESYPIMKVIGQAMQQGKNSEQTRMMLSLLFSVELTPYGNGEWLRRTIFNHIMEIASKRIMDSDSSAQGQTRLAKVREDLVTSVNIEVFFLDGIPRSKCFWSTKYTMAIPMKVTETIKDISVEEPRGRKLNQWIFEGNGKFRKRSQTRLLVHRDVPLVVGPRWLMSAIVDVSNDTHCGRYDVDKLANDPTLRQALGIKVTRQAEPFSINETVVVDLKGWIRLCGLWENGHFEDLSTARQEHILRTSCPNYLMGGVDAEEADSEEVNLLLGSYVQSQKARLTQVLHQDGNFIITYDPVEEKSSLYHYHIRSLQGVTKYFRSVTGDSIGFKDPENYTVLPDGVSTRVPFSRGYLMTGQDDHWLCLELDIGSPGLGGTSAGVIKVETVDLKNSLCRYARKNGINNLSFMPGRSQGLVATGSRELSDGNKIKVYLKLLDPAYASLLSTERIYQFLSEKHIVPDTVETVKITRSGETGGSILVFIQPEYLALSDLIRRSDNGLDDKALLSLCRELALFAQKIFKGDVICPDWTLQETMVLSRMHQERDGARTQSSWIGGNDSCTLFVSDFGSYMEKRLLSRSLTIKKPDYQSPEDRNPALSMQAEPYQVFVLGILFYQIMSRKPDVLPPVMMEPMTDRAGFEESVHLSTDGLRASLSKNLESAPALIGEMLSWDPAQRPSIGKVIESLDTLLGHPGEVTHE